MAFIFSLNSSKSFTSDSAPRRWKRPPNQPSRKRFSSSSWIDPTCLATWVNVMYPWHFRKKPAEFLQFEHRIVSFHVIPSFKFKANDFGKYFAGPGLKIGTQTRTSLSKCSSPASLDLAIEMQKKLARHSFR